MSEHGSSDAPDDGLSPERETPQTEQQDAALREAAAWVGGAVSAVGLGSTDGGDPCVVVYAGTPAPDLPEQVQGLPVRVVSSDPILALDEPEPEDPVEPTT